MQKPLENRGAFAYVRYRYECPSELRHSLLYQVVYPAPHARRHGDRANQGGAIRSVAAAAAAVALLLEPPLGDHLAVEAHDELRLLGLAAVREVLLAARRWDGRLRRLLDVDDRLGGRLHHRGCRRRGWDTAAIGRSHSLYPLITGDH